MENNNKWYIVNVVAGQENKVASAIKSMIVKDSVNKKITDVLVPNKSIIKVKKGQKIQEAQKLFPGYVFINADLKDGEVYGLINSIPKVMGFLGDKNNPKVISELEMEKILNASSENEQNKKIFTFEAGEILNIKEGSFESFSGVVESFDSEKQKIKISVLIFGRATSIELNVDQVEKTS